MFINIFARFMLYCLSFEYWGFYLVCFIFVVSTEYDACNEELNQDAAVSLMPSGEANAKKGMARPAHAPHFA